MEELPTPWLRVRGAGLMRKPACGGLTIVLPAWLVPTRRYCELRMLTGSVIQVIHQERFAGPKTWRNAWQGNWHNSELDPGVKCRALDRGTAQVLGDPRDLHSFLEGRRPNAHHAVDVRVTPEGFQLRFVDMLSSGAVTYPSPVLVSSLEHRLRVHPNHGGGNDASVLNSGARANSIARSYDEHDAVLRRNGYIADALVSASDKIKSSMAPDAPSEEATKEMLLGLSVETRRAACRQAIGRIRAVRQMTPFERKKVWEVAKQLLPSRYHPTNCRCTTQETQDMRSKIDDTTAESLPAALFLEGSTQGIIRATFNDGGGDYAYFTGGLDIQVGDAVVVASPYGDGPSGGTFDEACGGYLKVLRVVSLQPDVTAIERAAKWVISKVDTTAYVVRRARVEELRTIDAQIKRARIAAIEAMQLAELSKYSPELADLVAKRTALAGAPSEAEPVTPAA